MKWLAIDPAVSQHVLEQVAAQLNARGYSKVNANPDMFVEVSTMKTVQTDAYYSYWSSWYGGYYGGAYGFGWAPVAVPYVTSSTLGSLVLNVTDYKHPNDAAKSIPTVWAAVVNGVVDSSSQAQIQARADAGIVQAFEQSPYFTRNTP